MAKNKHSHSRTNLSLNLKYIRTLTGWSQEQLGLKCDLKRTYMGALERSEVNPGIDNVDRMAACLGVPGHVMILDPRDAHPLFLAALKRR